MTRPDAGQSVSEISAEPLFEKLFECSPDAILVANASGEMIRVNSRSAEMFGYARGELLGRPIEILVPERSRESHPIFRRDYMTRAAVQPTSVSLEARGRRKDGSEFPAEITLSPVIEVTDGPLVLAVVRDITARRQAESRRQESEEFLADIVNVIADPVFVKDEQHRWVILNDACCRLMQHSREELIGKSDYDFIGQEEADIYWAHDNLVFQTGREDTNEEKFTDAQGSVHTVVTRKALHVSPTGKKYIVGVIRDITDRKHTEEALRDREQQLESILENSTAVIYLKSLDGRYLKVNRQFELAFGLKKAEVIGKRSEELFPPDRAAHLQADDLKVIEAGSPMMFEHVLPQSDGPHTYISMKFPLLDSAGLPYAIGGVATDITDRKRTEEELRDREHLLQSILDNSPATIFIKDLEGRYLKVNRHCAEALGASEQQVIGKFLGDFFPKELADRIREHEQEVLEAGSAMQFEDIVPRKDGLHTSLAIKFPLFDSTGKPNAICGISTDITDRKRAEEALRESETRFRQIAENIRDVFWVRDAESYQVLYGSPAYEEIWGLPMETFYALPFE